jgi:hypothetical protein
MSPPFGGFDNAAHAPILGLTPPGYTMSPPFGGFDNTIRAPLLGLTPPGYTMSLVRGSESDASILNEIDRNAPCRQAQVFIERCQGWNLLAGTA